jgi:dihydrolipoamide dehydrogenase
VPHSSDSGPPSSRKTANSAAPCLNVGCIPSKALLASSDHFVFAKKEAAKHGIVLDKVSLDLATMLGRKDKVVKTLTGGVRALMKGNKITTFTGLGTIAGPGKVRVRPNESEPTEIAADHIIIATGSVPINLPSMPFDGENRCQQHRSALFRKAARKISRDWRRRDRPRARLGLEPPGLRGDGA